MVIMGVKKEVAYDAEYSQVEAHAKKILLKTTSEARPILKDLDKAYEYYKNNDLTNYVSELDKLTTDILNVAALQDKEVEGIMGQLLKVFKI